MEDRRPPPKFKPHPFTYHQELTVRIQSLTNEGVGVARVDGWVVFVAFALPGELVKCSVFRNHKSYSEADLAEARTRDASFVHPIDEMFLEIYGLGASQAPLASRLSINAETEQLIRARVAEIEAAARD